MRQTQTGGEIEIYPMALFPTLVVRNIQASAAWYCEALGFTNVYTMPVPDGYRLVFNGQRT